jgi:hypothetical protein
MYNGEKYDYFNNSKLIVKILTNFLAYIKKY